MEERKITKNYTQGGYEQTIKYILESKTIFFIDCTCGDFEHRRMYKSGLFADQKIFANACKHLQPIITIAEMQGLTLRKPKQMEGTDKCTAELKRFLIDRSEGICEMYMCEKAGICVHRRTRGSSNGKYNKHNCVLLCSDCHKKIHSKEFK